MTHYLHFSSAGEDVYRFETKPNVNILLLKAQGGITDEKVQAYIVKRLRGECENIKTLNVLCAPDADVREMEPLTAIFMHPKYCASDAGTFTEETTEAIMNIALHVGNKNRMYRNTMFFVLCQDRARPALYEKTKEYLACEAVLEDSASLLEKEQRTEVVSKRSKAYCEIAKYLIQAYCVAAKCQFNSETHKYEVIKMETMREFSDYFYEQIDSKMVSRLKEDEWLLAGIGKTTLQEAKLFPSADNPVSVQNIYSTFLKDTQKPMITSEDAVISSLNRYCEEGAFNIAE